MTAYKERIEWVDIVKFFCMFCVMISHLGGGGIALHLHYLYEPFFLCGFLFVSGYTYNNNVSFIEHIKKKTRQLLIPWILFSLLNITLSQIVSFHPEWHPGFMAELRSNLLQIRELGDGSMWFINALFVAYIPFYYFVKKYEDNNDSKNTDLMFALLCIVMMLAYESYIEFFPHQIFPWGSNRLPWHLEYIPYALSFMFFGYLFRKKYDSYLKECNVYVVMLVYLLIIYLPLFFQTYFTGVFVVVYKVIIAILGTLFIAVVSINVNSNKLSLFVGRNTLTYYGTHGKALALIEAIFRKITPSLYNSVIHNSLLSIIYSVLLGIVLCMVLIVPTIFINKYLPFFAGRRYSFDGSAQKK